MASTTNRDVAIFQLTNAGDTEASIGENFSVGFDYGITDKSTTAITLYDFQLPSRRTDVPTPANKGITNPDVGLQAPTLTIEITVNQSIARSPEIGRLAMWALQDKESRGVFSRGRFGIRNNKNVWCNFVPVNTAGWKLVDAGPFSDDITYGAKFDIKLVFEFGGDTSLLAAAILQTLDSGKY